MPIDRTAKQALDLNLLAGVVSDASKLKANNDTSYNFADGLETAQNNHALATDLAHPDGSVTGPKIRDGAVTSAKIAPLAVQQQHIAPGSVGPYQLQTGLATPVDVAAQLMKRGLDVTSAPFFAKGDGVTDDTASISSAITAIKQNGGGILYFPDGRYKISPSHTGALYFQDMINFEVYGSGNAEIFCDPVFINDQSTENNRMLRFEGCKNWSMHGLIINFQIDYASEAPADFVREDQAVFVYSYPDKINENFSIFDNTFIYNGPQLHSPLSEVTSRLSIVLIGSDTTVGPTTRLTNGFSIYGNRFINTLGRVIYLLLAQNGSVYGNTFSEIGRLVYPDGSLKGGALALAVRILGCKNITATNNTVNAYNGDIYNPLNLDKGSVTGFVCDSGVTGGISEDIVIVSNAVNLNKCAGNGFTFGSARNVIFANNMISGLETVTVDTRAIRSETSADPAYNVKIEGNNFYQLVYPFDLRAPSSRYTNVSIDRNNIINGTNAFSGGPFFSGTESKAIIGSNYYSDKLAFCVGPNRNREIYASQPPSTGVFTRGDICHNTDWDIGGAGGHSPVRSWVYQYNDGTKNIWRPLTFAIFRSSSLPAIPTWTGAAEAHTGIMALDVTGNANGVLYIYNGANWIKSDGTLHT